MNKRVLGLKESLERLLEDFREEINPRNLTLGSLALGIVTASGLAAWLYYKRPEVSAPVYTPTSEVITPTHTSTATYTAILTGTPTLSATATPAVPQYHRECENSNLILKIDDPNIAHYTSDYKSIDVLLMRGDQIIKASQDDEAFHPFDEDGRGRYLVDIPDDWLGEVGVKVQVYSEGVRVYEDTGKISIDELCAEPTKIVCPTHVPCPTCPPCETPTPTYTATPTPTYMPTPTGVPPTRTPKPTPKPTKTPRPPTPTPKPTRTPKPPTPTPPPPPTETPPPTPTTPPPTPTTPPPTPTSKPTTTPERTPIPTIQPTPFDDPDNPPEPPDRSSMYFGGSYLDEGAILGFIPAIGAYIIYSKNKER